MRDMRVLLEPGRFLVGPAGAYLTRVVDRKRVGAPSWRSPTAASTTSSDRPWSASRTACGCSARTPGRGRGRSVAGPSARASTSSGPARRAGTGVDLIAVLDAGAYGFTESMPFFLSLATPAEVAVRGGEARVSSDPRIEPEAWLDQQVIPAW